MTEFILHIGWLTLSMSCIILLLLLGSRLFGKRFSAKSRYIAWTVVLLSLCVGIGLFRFPSLFTLEVSLPVTFEETPDLPAQTSKAEQIPVSPEAEPPAVSVPSAVSPGTPTLPNAPASQTPASTAGDAILPAVSETPEREVAAVSPQTVIFCLWAIGAALHFTVNFVVYLRSTRKYARGKRLCGAKTEDIFRTLCRGYKIKRTPALYVCEAVGSPVLYGYTKPTVLLPSIPLSEDSLVGVLAHELTHYRRGDIWIKLLCLVAESLYWFNPLVHLAAARCNAEMELSCDEAVLAGLSEDSRRSYGNVMLEIVKHCSRRRSGLTTGFNPHKNAVRERLLNILDMSGKKRGRAIIAACLTLCLVAGTVIGCAVKDSNTPEKDSSMDEETRSETVYTVESDITAVDSRAFAGVDTDSITELVIGKDVETIDFAYLNTFPVLRKVTVHAENENYRNITSIETGANVVTSRKTSEMLYIPAEDHQLYLPRESELHYDYTAEEDIQIYVCGGILTVYFKQDAYVAEAYWVAKSIEYDGITKALSFDRQLTGNCGFSVFRTTEGFVTSHTYYGWSNTMIFSGGRVIEFNPASEEYSSFGISTTGDGMVFYPGDAGELCYRRIAHNMVVMQTVDWFFELYSPDQFWMEEGIAHISDGKIVFTPRATYTVADRFVQQGTTMEEFFEEHLQTPAKVYGYATLEEVFAANTEKQTYEINGFDIRTIGSYPEIEAAIREKVGKKTGALTREDFLSVTSFGLVGKGITDIAPLAALTNLTWLSLQSNAVVDISPLYGLPLTDLNLESNKVSDIAPLGSLAAIERLNLTNNPITDISALASLTTLLQVYATYCPIMDFSPIAHVPHVEPYPRTAHTSVQVCMEGEESPMMLGQWLEKGGLSLVAYSVLDLDGDGDAEMVWQIARGADTEHGCVILQVRDATVYGYFLYHRPFHSLKADGTFRFSSGVADHGIGKLSFSGDAYTVDKLAYCESDGHGNVAACFIAGKSVSKADYDAYVRAQEQKPDATWTKWAE